MTLIATGKVRYLHPVLRKLCQLQETVFKLFGLLTVALELLELFAIINLILQSPLHNVFSHLLDTSDEKRFHFVALLSLVDSFSNTLALRHSLFLDQYLQVLYCFAVIGLKSLHVLDNFLLNFFALHT